VTTLRENKNRAHMDKTPERPRQKCYMIVVEYYVGCSLAGFRPVSAVKLRNLTARQRANLEAERQKYENLFGDALHNAGNPNYRPEALRKTERYFTETALQEYLNEIGKNTKVISVEEIYD
jgi:hypothetical protein